MKTNSGLQLSALLLLVISFFLPQSISAQNNFDFEDDQQIFVVLQLPFQNTIDFDSATDASKQRLWVDALNGINEELGYAKMEKKIASFDFSNGDGYNTYMTIRTFEDLESGSAYALKLDEKIENLLLGDIKEPFPISAKNYKLCIEAKDFTAYYKRYKVSGK